MFLANHVLGQVLPHPVVCLLKIKLVHKVNRDLFYNMDLKLCHPKMQLYKEIELLEQLKISDFVKGIVGHVEIQEVIKKTPSMQDVFLNVVNNE